MSRGVIDQVLSFIARRLNTGTEYNIVYNGTTTWSSVGTVTLAKGGIYEVWGWFGNSAVYGVGYSPTSATNVAAAHICENQTASSVKWVIHLPAGTYKVWQRCAGTGRNTIRFTLLLAD